MLEMAKKTILFGIGALSFTREKGERLVKDLTEKGKLSQVEASYLVMEIMKKGAEEKEILQKMLKEEVEKAQENLGLVTREDLTILENRIRHLEARVEQLTKEVNSK